MTPTIGAPSGNACPSTKYVGILAIGSRAPVAISSTLVEPRSSVTYRALASARGTARYRLDPAAVRAFVATSHSQIAASCTPAACLTIMRVDPGSQPEVALPPCGCPESVTRTGSLIDQEMVRPSPATATTHAASEDQATDRTEESPRASKRVREVTPSRITRSSIA